MRLHGTPYPLPVLPDQSCGAGSGCHTDIGTTPAAKTRFFYEWLTGNHLSGVDACAPVAPCAVVNGHDHSGGIMGRPIQRCLWSTMLGTTHTSDVTNGDAPQAVVNPGGLVASPDGYRIYAFDSALYGIWIPGAGSNDGDSAHAVCQLGILTYCDIDGLTIHGEWNNAGRSLTETTAAANGFKHWTWTNNVNLSPGCFNDAWLKIWLEGDGIYATERTLSIYSVGLYQIRDAP